MLRVVGIVQNLSRRALVFQRRAAARAFATSIRRKDVRGAKHFHDVVIPTNDPETLAVGAFRSRLMPVHRIVLPQPIKRCMRKPLAESEVVREIHRAAQHSERFLYAAPG